MINTVQITVLGKMKKIVFIEANNGKFKIHLLSKCVVTPVKRC